jgi:hypothetical protein
LDQATVKARNHESRHVYSLTEMGLTKEYLEDRFAEVFSEYDFK